MKTWNGYPEIFSSSQALEISRQYLLLRTVILQNIVAGPEFCKDSRFQWGSPYDIGSKRTNHQFGCFGEVCKSNILMPSKIPFIWKCVFLFFSFSFSSKIRDCVSNYASVGIFFLSSFSFFFFNRRIYESVNIFSLLLSGLQGYPSMEYLYLADSSLARVGSWKHLSICDFVLRNFVFF